MKHHIENLLQIAVKQLQELGNFPALPPVIQIEATRDKRHGDFAANIALVLAKAAQQKPRDVAQRIVDSLPASPYVTRVEIAGPGFINFFLSTDALNQVISKILSEKQQFGRSEIGRHKKVLIEFVSSNPTGPLHVGHGRHAAFGAVIGNLLDCVGFDVYREYYVNDGGRQMDIVAASVWLRYLTLCGEQLTFPANGYQGEYVTDIARAIMAQHHRHFFIAAEFIFKDLPLDAPQGGDKEIYIDAVIERAKSLLGPDKYAIIFDLTLDNILTEIREDLAEFGVHFDNWFSERQLVSNTTSTSNVMEHLLNKLRENGHLYEQEGAIWFRSTALGDEKDRVLVRSNGQCTYFANDVAYHITKFERGFDLAIDIFGADHHGYVPRMKAAMMVSGINPERLIYLLLQFVSLYRGEQQLAMSTRGGNFVTLRELRTEVGNDAARFFYVMRKCEQHIDFDLELAKSQSNENPVFYVQYAHARICSVLRQLAERHLVLDIRLGEQHLNLLIEEHERELLNTLSRYPDVITQAAIQYEPHQLTNYLRDLAANFHAYYNSHQFLVDNELLRNARLALILAVKQVLVNGFQLLGIKAPETM